MEAGPNRAEVDSPTDDVNVSEGNSPDVRQMSLSKPPMEGIENAAYEGDDVIEGTKNGQEDGRQETENEKRVRFIEQEKTNKNNEEDPGRSQQDNSSHITATKENMGSDREWDSSILADLKTLAMTFYRKQPEDDDDADYVLPPELNYLVLAIKNDSPHLVEVLLDKYTAQKIYNALLYCINLGRDHITKIFLDHPKYQAVRQVAQLIRSGVLQAETESQTEQGVDEEGDESVLAADVTPLMLAAQRNQFEVVQNLLEKGDRIEEPHSSCCNCQSCELMRQDELREAKTKLNTYKALASDSYVILASEDPVITAFDLVQKLKKLAAEEKHFKAEYLSLADQIEDLSGRLLDRVRDGRELDILLNETSGSGMSSYDNLARLNLAIQHGEKKFVSHPACQKKLASLWMSGLNASWVATPLRATIFTLALSVSYIFLACVYWVKPSHKIGKFLQIPLVKFTASTISYFIFVGLVVGYGGLEEPTSSRPLCEFDKAIGQLCVRYMNNATDPYINGTTTFVRPHTVGPGTALLVIWLIGMIWETTKKLFIQRTVYFTQNMYNILDFFMICLFVLAFLLKFIVISLVNRSLSYFSEEESWSKLASLDEEALSRVYWLNADRSYWAVYDLTIIEETIFAVASLICVFKLTYVFTISERIGPLIISLAKMIEDMVAFMVVFVFIMGSFVVGFNNLFAYFYLSMKRIHPENDDIISSFSDLECIVKQCFWSIFGFAELNDDTFYTNENGEVTSITGQVMFALYNWMMIIILINMLIAMMSRSYEFIAETEDTEWKFARTKLFLEYIGAGFTLPPPLNLIPTKKGVNNFKRKLAKVWSACRSRWDDFRKSCVRKHKTDHQKNLTDFQSEINGYTINSAMTSWAIRRSERMKYLVTDNTTPNQAKDMKIKHKKPRQQYLEVIGEIKKRFIQQCGKGKGGEEDSTSEEIDQLKQDMSTLRQQLTSNFHRQDKERARMTEMLSDIISGLSSTRDLFIKQHEELREQHTEKTSKVRYRVSDLDQRISEFKAEVNDWFNQVQSRMEELSKDNRSAIDDLKENVTKIEEQIGALQKQCTELRESIVISDYDIIDQGDQSQKATADQGATPATPRGAAEEAATSATGSGEGSGSEKEENESKLSVGKAFGFFKR